MTHETTQPQRGSVLTLLLAATLCLSVTAAAQTEPTELIGVGAIVDGSSVIDIGSVAANGIGGWAAQLELSSSRFVIYGRTDSNAPIGILEDLSATPLAAVAFRKEIDIDDAGNLAWVCVRQGNSERMEFKPLGSNSYPILRVGDPISAVQGHVISGFRGVDLKPSLISSVCTQAMVGLELTNTATGEKGYTLGFHGADSGCAGAVALIASSIPSFTFPVPNMPSAPSEYFNTSDQADANAWVQTHINTLPQFLPLAVQGSKSANFNPTTASNIPVLLLGTPANLNGAMVGGTIPTSAGGVAGETWSDIDFVATNGLLDRFLVGASQSPIGAQQLLVLGEQVRLRSGDSLSSDRVLSNAPAQAAHLNEAGDHVVLWQTEANNGTDPRDGLILCGQLILMEGEDLRDYGTSITSRTVTQFVDGQYGLALGGNRTLYSKIETSQSGSTSIALYEWPVPDTLPRAVTPILSSTGSGMDIVSDATGGVIDMLYFGDRFAAPDHYFLLGSLVPTPSIPQMFGNDPLPVVFDAWTNFMITSPNTLPYPDSFGQVNYASSARASIVLAPGALGSLPGLAIYHGFVGLQVGTPTLLDVVDYSTVNAVTVLLP